MISSGFPWNDKWRNNWNSVGLSWNWTAAVGLMDKNKLSEPPCTVTASYSVTLRRPTPLGRD